MRHAEAEKLRRALEYAYAGEHRGVKAEIVGYQCISNAVVAHDVRIKRTLSKVQTASSAPLPIPV